MKKLLFLIPAILLSQVANAAPKDPKFSASGSSALKIEGPTQTPEGTLQAGDYTIRIVDHLSDRMIVEVSGSNGSNQKLLGVPTRDIRSLSTSGPILIKGSSASSALRGFSFAKGNVVEFVYPKNDAVALAKSNGVKVLAMDPASDGLVAQKNASISDGDMKIVTLWMLTPVAVGPGIEAARYQSDTNHPLETAAVRKPVIGRLPKTASELPLLWLGILCSMGAAIGLTLRRITAASI